MLHTEIYAHPADAREIIARYRDPERMLGYCRECTEYGSSWACPSFPGDSAAPLSSYRGVAIIAVKIFTDGTPATALRDLMEPVSHRLDATLRLAELRFGGISCSGLGGCRRCAACTRGAGKACRHPDLVRPSLEARGFDVTTLAGSLLGIELLWSADGRPPVYLTTVGALFCDDAPTAAGWIESALAECLAGREP